MNGHVLVSLFKSVVLLDVMQVIPPDDNGSAHLHLSDDTGEDTAADGHFADEGAFLVNVVAFTSLYLNPKVSTF